MAINFYLNEINDSNKIHVQANAAFIERIGEFDTGTLSLEWSRIKNKIVPFTKLFIEDTDNADVWCFVVLNDSVDVVKKNKQVLYIHNLTVTQNTYEMTTQLVRNSVFTQPTGPIVAELNASGYSAVNQINYGGGTIGYTNQNDVQIAYDVVNSKYLYVRDRVLITSRDKVRKAHLDISFITAAYGTVAETVDGFQMGSQKAEQYNQFTRLDLKIVKYVSSSTTTPTATLDIRVQNGTTYVELDKSFFQTGYWYEIQLNTDNLPQVSDFSNSYLSFTGGEAPSGETYVYPTLQSIIRCKLVIDVCYYTLLDVLRTLRNQTRKLYNGLASKDHLFLLPDSGTIHDELESVVAPNFTFTNQDLWSCVNDVLSYIDAIPTLDENNYLGYEYLNDYSKTPIEIKMVDESSGLSSDYYTNSLMANYQNAKQDNAIFYPAPLMFKRTGSKVYGVPSKDDYQMTVDKPIDFIDNVYLYLENSESWDYEIRYYTLFNGLHATKHYIDFYGKFADHILDISSAVYEQNLYALLPMGDQDDPTANQLNTLYYQRGSNAIYLGGVRKDEQNISYEVYKKAINLVVRQMYGVAEVGDHQGTFVNGDITPAIYNLKYCIKYHAVYDGRASEESIETKHVGETYVNQEQGGVNLNRMGNNMQGLIAKLGNESEMVTIPVTEYGSRIRKGSLWVDDDGKKYIANMVKTTFSTSSQKVMVEAQFSRNFNLMSQFTRVDQEKRFYEINDNLISKGYENITEFVYFSFSSRDSFAQTVAYSSDMLHGIIKENFISVSVPQKADFATITTYDQQNSVNPDAENFYIPHHAYGLGNSICFEMGFESPINAADRIIVTTSNNIDNVKNETTLYTEQGGFADVVSLKLYASPYTSGAIYTGQNFPDMTSVFGSYTFTELVNINRLYYYKKPNEILHLNYSIAFIAYPSEDIFFGDLFINYNSIIRKEYEKNPNKKFYLYAGDELYSIIDNKANDSHTAFGEVTPTYNETVSSNVYKGSLTFTLNSGSITKANAWCITDEDGNIYLAANQELTNATSVTLYFYSRRWRV